MPGSFALRRLGISAVAAVLALALSACGGEGPAAELAAAPASEGGGSSPMEEQAAAPAPAGGGIPPVEEQAAALASEGGGSSPMEEQAAAPASEGGGSSPVEEQAAAPASEGGGIPPVEEQAAAPAPAGGGIPPVERRLSAAPAPAGGGIPPVERRLSVAPAPADAGEGGGEIPPVEERLAVEPGAEDPGWGVSVGEGPGAGAPAAPGGGSTSSSAAMWHVFGEVGTGEGAAALVTSGELAGVSAEAIATTAVRYAKGNSVRADGRLSGYLQSPYPQNDLWRYTDRGAKRTMSADSGVTQSSRGFFADDDQMAVGIGHDAVGAVTYELVRAHSDNDRRLNVWALDSEAEGANVRKWSSDDGKGAVFRRDDSGGSLWAVVTTDVSGPGDTDWLATGMWAYTPANGVAEDYWFGVFADGGDRIESGFYSSERDGRGKSDGVTGVATYAGGASGVYTRPVDGAQRNDFFEADVTLTADFSAKKSDWHAGEVSGSISGFEIAGGSLPGAPVLTLKGAVGRSIGNSGGGGGMGGGQASMSFGGNEWTGLWGSQFYGRDGGGAPSSIAGTFAAMVDAPDATRPRSAIPDAQAFVGAFAAYRTAWEDTPVRQLEQPDWVHEPDPFDDY